MSEDTTSDTLADDTGVMPSDGAEAVETDFSPDSGDSSLDQSEIVRNAISQTLGKKFNTADAALKAIKDTQDYVGSAGKFKKAAETLAKKFGNGDLDVALKTIGNMNEPNDSQATTPAAAQLPTPGNNNGNLERQVEELTFVVANPELKDQIAVLRELQGSSGKSLEEVAKSEIFQKVRGYDQSEQSRKVLQPNQRLGGVTDKFDEARKMQGQNHTKAAEMAVGAVLDVFKK